MYRMKYSNKKKNEDLNFKYNKFDESTITLQVVCVTFCEIGPEMFK